MKYSENETTINYDYAGNEVSIFTTRRGVKNNVVKRLGEDKVSFRYINKEGEKEVSWLMDIDMDDMRNPYYVSKIVSDNEG